MGVDAEMRIQTPDLLSDREILKLSFDIAEAFGRDSFWIDREKKRSAISRWVSEDEYDVAPSEGPFIMPNLWSRYYGIDGYERGDLPFLLAVAEWFEHRIPGCKVFYGGDTGDGYEPWDKARRAEFFAHFAEVGHKPYSGYFQRRDPVVLCDWCEEPMRIHTWGPYGRRKYLCVHCGHEETREAESA